MAADDRRQRSACPWPRVAPRTMASTPRKKTQSARTLGVALSASAKTRGHLVRRRVRAAAAGAGGAAGGRVQPLPEHSKNEGVVVLVTAPRATG